MGVVDGLGALGAVGGSSGASEWTSAACSATLRGPTGRRALSRLPQLRSIAGAPFAAPDLLWAVAGVFPPGPVPAEDKS